ncbi:MAG: Fe-S-containing protein [Acidobacteriota bacterium]|jgi:high-affinity iron transporter
MFESFVIMLREGIEAALVIAIALVVVKRSGRRDLERAVFWGLSLAVAASIVFAAVLAALSVNSDAYEGIFYWIAALFVISMMVWMHRKAGTLRTDIEERVERAAAAGSAVRKREAFGLGAFAFFMVFREGAEAVLFLSAVRLTTDALLSFLGSLLGLGAAVVFAVLFIRGSLRVDLRRFFTVTTWVLAIFVLQLLVNGYHELAESGLMPADRKSMALIGPVVKNNGLFIMAILAIPLFVWMTRRKPAPATAENVSPAQRRLHAARLKKDRRYRLAAAAASLLLISLVGVVYAREIRPRNLPEPQPVVQRGDAVVVPLSDLADKKLHHYGYPIDGRLIQFLAMKLPDGRIKAALNACKICGPVGYVQDGQNLECLNCDSEINTDTLGTPGGCNPIPLPSKIDGKYLEIPVSALVKAEPVFNQLGGPVYRDPVCGMKLLPGQVGATITYKGKVYHFCKMPSCRKLFKEDPAKYVH